MINKLLHQIFNERKANRWAFIGIFIAFLLMWFCMDALYVAMDSLLSTNGYEIDHVYQLEFREDPNYKYETSSEDSVVMLRQKTIEEQLRRVKRISGVENACYYQGSEPYGNTIFQGYASEDTTVLQANIRYVSPEYFDVFKVNVPKEVYENWNSFEPRQKAIITEDFSEKLFGTVNSKGKEFYDYYVRKYAKKEGLNIDLNYKVAEVIPKMRKQEFSVYEPFIITPLSLWWYSANYRLAIRVNPNEDTKLFARQFLEHHTQDLSFGTSYLYDVKSFDDIKEAYNLGTGSTRIIKGLGFLLFFFLFNLFLGIVGTFWFRTQGRIPSIGLQKALGATNKRIALSILCEAHILVLIASVPAIIICGIMAYQDILFTYNDLMENTLGRFAISILLTLVLMLLIVTFAVFFPARRAMKVNPIDALLDQ